VLRACRRVLRPGGRLAFYTIHPARRLTAAQRRRVSRDGPVAVATPRPHHEMLSAAGFVEVRERDVTEAFLVTLEGWIEAFDAWRDHLVRLLGEDAFEERQADRRAHVAVAEEGLLRRSLFVATAP